MRTAFFEFACPKKSDGPFKQEGSGGHAHRQIRPIDDALIAAGKMSSFEEIFAASVEAKVEVKDCVMQLAPNSGKGV